MYSNIKYIIAACRLKKVPFKFLDKNKTVIEIKDKFFFSNSTTPLNNQGVAKISEDKEYSYILLNKYVRMPKTIGYLDPNTGKGKEFLKFDTFEKICTNIRAKFKFPLVVKRDNGSEGSNVFICKNEVELENGIRRIFDQKSKNYDYVALAQEKVHARKEYRVIILNNRIELIYEKRFTDNDFNFEAIVITDKDLHERINDFIAPIFYKIDLHWNGLDIISDNSNRLWLIELNTCPSFEEVKAKDKNKIIAIYEKILDVLIELP